MTSYHFDWCWLMYVQGHMLLHIQRKVKCDLFTFTVLLGLVCLTVPCVLVRAFLVSYLFSNMLSLLLSLPPAPIVDCCLPPQFLLLSVTAIAIVVAAATAETASAEAVAIAICPRCRRN